MSDEKKVGWWEDLRTRIENLDTRETLLQKEVAKLAEKIEWLIKLREEQRENRKEKSSWNRWVLGMILSVVFSLLGLVVGLWRLIQG